MRRLLSIIFFTIIGQSAFAKDWFSYYIYIQKEYIQGPWLRTDILDKTGNYTYLQPKQFEELFSISGDGQEIADAILAHLKKETPGRYKFKYTLSISKDTVIIKTQDTISDFEAVKNELTASFTLNSFSAVKITQCSKAKIFLLKDITVPYMDLIFPNQIAIQMSQSQDSLQKDTLTSALKTETLINEQSENKVSIWLIISLTINLVLTFVLLRRRK
jgi:hypothetical protein